MRQEKSCVAACLGFCCAVLLSCGGGGISSSPSPQQPPSSSVADFQVSASPSNLSLGVGGSATAQVTVSVTGQGSTGFQVTLTTTASSGVTASVSPSTLSPGQNATLNVNVDSSLIAPTSFEVSINASRASDNVKHAVPLTVQLLIGGGTLNPVVRTTGVLSVPASSAAATITYVNSIMAAIAVKGGIYDLCGSATGTRVTELLYDPTSPHGFFFDGGFDFSTNRMHPVIHMDALPHPGTDGTDEDFDHKLIHELSNALQADISAGKAQTFSVTDEVQLDPHAETCASAVLRFLNQNGRHSAPSNESFDDTLLLDPITKYFDSDEQAGDRELPGYDSGFQYPGGGVYRLLAAPTPNGAGSPGAYEEKFYAAMNEKGRLLTSDELHTLQNSFTIDAQQAGDWIASHFPIYYTPPTPNPGVILLVLPFRPQFPEGFTVFGVQRNVDGTGSPINSGPLIIQATDKKGNVRATMNTDLANTGFVGNTTYGNDFRNSLPQDNFNLSVTLTINNQKITKKMVLCNVPFANAGSLTNTVIGPSLVFAMAVHKDGSAADGVFNVAQGKVTFTSGGVVVVQANASGIVTVNGNTYTAAPNGGRMVYVQVD
jgi:hypothetical protein